MKHFIDNENCKVRLAWVTPSFFTENIICLGVDGNEYEIPKGEILDDGEPDYVEISIPIEFPNGFVPPETFDDNRCMWCPFYCVEEDVENYCSHKHYKQENCCPIKKCF